MPHAHQPTPRRCCRSRRDASRICACRAAASIVRLPRSATRTRVDSPFTRSGTMRRRARSARGRRMTCRARGICPTHLDARMPTHPARTGAPGRCIERRRGRRAATPVAAALTRSMGGGDRGPRMARAVTRARSARSTTSTWHECRGFEIELAAGRLADVPYTFAAGRRLGEGDRRPGDRAARTVRLRNRAAGTMWRRRGSGRSPGVPRNFRPAAPALL